MIEYTEDSVIMSWNGKGRLFDKLHTEYDKFEEQLNKDQKFITIHKLLNNPEKMKVLEKICYDNNCDEYISRTYSELYDKYKDLCSTIVNRYSYIIDDYKWERLSDGMQNYYEFENYLANNLSEEFINKLSLPLAHVSTGGPDIRIFLDNLTNEEAKWFRKLVRKFPNPKRENGMPYFNVWATKNSSSDIFIIF